MLVILGIAVFCITLSMISCGTGPQGQRGPSGFNISTGSGGSAASPDAIQTIVNNYNEGLISQGSDPLTQGLKCTLYTVPNMPATPCLLASSVPGCTVLSTTVEYAAVGSFTYNGAVDQPNENSTGNLNVLPTQLQPLYQNNIALTCTGYIVNTDYNYHEFDLASDDGSLLYINDSLLVNNDGAHAVSDVKAEKYLQAQVYSFQLNYFQVNSNTALVVNMDNSPIPAEALWH